MVVVRTDAPPHDKRGVGCSLALRTLHNPKIAITVKQLETASRKPEVPENADRAARLLEGAILKRRANRHETKRIALAEALAILGSPEGVKRLLGSTIPAQDLPHPAPSRPSGQLLRRLEIHEDAANALIRVLISTAASIQVEHLQILTNSIVYRWRYVPEWYPNFCHGGQDAEWVHEPVDECSKTLKALAQEELGRRG